MLPAAIYAAIGLQTPNGESIPILNEVSAACDCNNLQKVLREVYLALDCIQAMTGTIMATAKSDTNADGKKKLCDLVYYSVDKASPYALAQHEATNTLDKIADYTAASLGITDQGMAIMWLWINAHCQPEAKPVGADVASKCEKVADVRDAVLKNMVSKS